MNKIYKAKLAAAKNCYKCGGMVKKYKDGGMVTSVADAVPDHMKSFDIRGESRRLETAPAKKMSDSERRKMYKKTGDGIRKK
jgi:hypothetical protein